MNKNNTIINNSNSRRNFLRNFAKWFGSTAILATVVNSLSSKIYASDNPDSTATGDEPLLGGLSMVGFNFAPRGWAFCDGQILPINQNQSLYSLLGTTYGGDGRTSFALPDLRGRGAVHRGDGYSLGQKGGSETTTLVTSNLPPHTHNLLVHSGAGNNDNPNGQSISKNSEGIDHYITGNANENAHNNSIANAGGGQAFNNMQPFLAINFIIALQGLFPSRN